MEYVPIGLAPLNGARAFADAVWKDELHTRSDFTFFGVPLVELPDGFTLSCRVDLDGAKDCELLYEAEGALRVTVRDARANQAPNDYDERYGNYFNFPLPDGSCPVLEALLPGPAGRIGIPLGALERPEGRHDLRIVWNGTYFTMDLDGHRDEDFPIGPLLWPKGDRGKACSPRVTDFAFSFGAPKEKETSVTRPDLTSPLSPFGQRSGPMGKSSSRCPSRSRVK